jgi:uncharacterized protein YbcI
LETPDHNVLLGGDMLDAVSNEMVALHRRQFGRGPATTKSFLIDDMLVCVMHDVFIPAEKTLIADGHLDRVREMRQLHQLASRAQLEAPVARITGRAVLGIVSAVNVDPDLAIEIFMLAPAREVPATPS